jgi:hypothetical protein
MAPEGDSAEREDPGEAARKDEAAEEHREAAREHEEAARQHEKAARRLEESAREPVAGDAADYDAGGGTLSGKDDEPDY